MSAFDRLKDIIGDDLATTVMKCLGGRVIRIRKRLDLIREEYLRSQQYYDTCTLAEGSRRLKCDKRTLKAMRRQLPKSYK